MKNPRHVWQTKCPSFNFYHFFAGFTLTLTFAEICPSFTHQPPAGFQIRLFGVKKKKKHSWVAHWPTPTTLSLPHHLIHSHMHNTQITPLPTHPALLLLLKPLPPPPCIFSRARFKIWVNRIKHQNAPATSHLWCLCRRRSGGSTVVLSESVHGESD